MNVEVIRLRLWQKLAQRKRLPRHGQHWLVCHISVHRLRHSCALQSCCCLNQAAAAASSTTAPPAP